MSKKTRNKALLLMPFALAGAVVAVLGALNPSNYAATDAEHSDPRLRTRRYRCSVSEAHNTIEAIIPTLATYGRPWNMRDFMGGEKGGEFDVHVPVLVFTDDLTITLRAAPDSVVVTARSSARLGRSDLGENRRHLLQLLGALDAKLPSF